METTIKEKYLKDYPLPITIEKIYTIIEQMKYCICKIFLKDSGTGTGFFFKIPYNNKLYPVLITNYHIINDKYLEKNQEIHCSINNNEKNLIIKIDNRKIYLNKQYDITIIEIKELDNISNYLEIDDNLFKDNIEFSYEGKTIYDIQYPKSENVSVSFGIIKEIKDSYDIIHLCSTDSGSSGSPILNMATNKVIGIHKEASNTFNFNKGTFLKIPINEYIEQKINISQNILNYVPSKSESTPVRLFLTLKDENFEFEEVSCDFKGKMLYKYNYNKYFGCWNEVLKCLCNIDDFYDYFKNNTFIMKKNSFLSLFKIIIENIELNNHQDNKDKYRELINFRKIFKKEKNIWIEKIIDKLWLSPYDLITFILDNLHDDLKTIEKKDYVNTFNNDLINLQKTYSIPDTQKEKISNETNTFIGNLFYGIERIERKVSNCDKYYGSPIYQNLIYQNHFSPFPYSNKKSDFETLKIQSYKKYDYYHEYDFPDPDEPEEDEYSRYLQNPFFYLMPSIQNYKGPRVATNDESGNRYYLIFAPKILILTYTFKLLMHFNYLGHNYALIGLIGTRSTKFFNSFKNDKGNFFCIYKSKENKWFKFFDNKTREIKIINEYDDYYKNLLIFSYNKESEEKIKDLVYEKDDYELLIYKKTEQK